VLAIALALAMWKQALSVKDQVVQKNSYGVVLADMEILLPRLDAPRIQAS
jgi:hypothetical protein